MTSDWFIARAGMLAALLLLGVSTFMNLRYGLSLAKTDIDRWIFAATSVGADAMKALAPFFIWSAWRARRWVITAAATLLWSVCTVYAVASALGFAALTRAEVVGTTAGKQETLTSLRAEYARKDGQRSALGLVQPSAVLASQIEQQKQGWRWPASKECREITLKETRTFCDALKAFTQGHARSTEAEKLDTELAELRERIAVLATVGGLDRGDPQASFIARLSGVSFANIQTALTLLAVALVEVGSGLGLFVASRYRALSERDVEAPAVAQLALDPPVELPHGDVAQFVLAELEECSGARLTIDAMVPVYVAWCSRHGVLPLPEAEFARFFARLAAEIGYDLGVCDGASTCTGLSVRPVRFAAAG